ncbi:hypothetical protein CWI38_0089p0020 [Hamiltosporidium tvaerminnensis]|uniref:V-ATPase proteolipid subunit C-like domain-containing protein n=2 Tax=Hamiltosporidium TaxID=1176354 RepID=A0A4Q9L1W0_9MICR|nr:hypothetical protein CWI37_1753p0020 [Hamiltosporidium tvaerminnensis]TBU00720.1 hypothetical protein CWI39_1598p0010 [Hamiltosporidium magnivora]TBU01076.1 hypothetical protein CWI36_1446p0020 [Hamiltosporidium magnivora]TBU20322.1 hypothetical protein CWI38_0089p0020 [Hamiltosporidium tvaerminnensis]
MSAHLMGSIGIVILVGLSAYAASEGIALSGTSSILYCQRRSIITQSYVALIMASTVFMYAFILAIAIMSAMTKEYTIEIAFQHFGASLIYGLTGLFIGNSMGKISKTSFKVLNQMPSFFFSFVLLIATVEVVLVFSFIFSLILIYKTS